MCFVPFMANDLFIVSTTQIASVYRTLACSRLTFMSDLQRNRVSSQEPSGPEAETLPLGRRIPRYRLDAVWELRDATCVTQKSFKTLHRADRWIKIYQTQLLLGE
ncbi:hypothetical protein AVEN_236887-1 [Araneus ventricosus]|uniref:Uncharacterized protein n=1 Tax=Araneus ventricosus TaxID=182803 RepID=A0A4Y2F3E5_ARAVE|nr:hypothetical protein AVEN_236887-1 [Araneus ventricosus]